MHRHHARAHAERSGCCEVTVWRLGDPDRESDGCSGGCCCCCCCHGHHRHHGECSCEEGHGFRRRFVSRAERIAQLEAYLAELQAEAQAVQEEISRLRKSD